MLVSVSGSRGADHAGIDRNRAGRETGHERRQDLLGHGAGARSSFATAISRALPAQALLQQLFSWRPEVMIEVEFLEVSDSDIINYGFNVTNQFPAIYLGQILNNVVEFPSGVTALADVSAAARR